MKFIEKLAARERNARENGTVLMAFLGDSVTHGVFDLINDPAKPGFVPHHLPEQTYAARFADRLNELFPIATVNTLNAGINGDNAAGGLKRLQRDVLRFQPDVVVVNFGLNDSGNPDPDAGVAAYAANMRAIFEQILASGSEAILLTPNYMCTYVHARVEGDFLRGIAENICHTQNDGILDRYVDAARAVARELNVPIADAYHRWQRMSALGVDTTALLSNGINHPTVEMHEIFVQELLRTAFEN